MNYFSSLTHCFLFIIIAYPPKFVTINYLDLHDKRMNTFISQIS